MIVYCHDGPKLTIAGRHGGCSALLGHLVVSTDPFGGVGQPLQIRGQILAVDRVPMNRRNVVDRVRREDVVEGCSELLGINVAQPDEFIPVEFVDLVSGNSVSELSGRVATLVGLVTVPESVGSKQHAVPVVVDPGRVRPVGQRRIDEAQRSPEYVHLPADFAFRRVGQPLGRWRLRGRDKFHVAALNVELADVRRVGIVRMGENDGVDPVATGRFAELSGDLIAVVERSRIDQEVAFLSSNQIHRHVAVTPADVVTLLNPVDVVGELDRHGAHPSVPVRPSVAIRSTTGFIISMYSAGSSLITFPWAGAIIAGLNSRMRRSISSWTVSTSTY